MNKIENIIKKGICGLIPIYQTNIGNGTKLITRDGDIFIDQRTIKTVLSIIAQYYTIHIGACRTKYGKVLHQRLSVPILINNKLLLVPFKMRKPIFMKDGAKGYINLYDIEKIKEQEKNTIIILKNGIEIKVLNTIKTVQDHINKAKVVAGEGLHDVRGDEPKEFNNFYIEYNRPATRGDIARLQEEIFELRDILKKVLVSSKKE